MSSDHYPLSSLSNPIPIIILGYAIIMWMIFQHLLDFFISIQTYCYFSYLEKTKSQSVIFPCLIFLCNKIPQKCCLYLLYLIPLLIFFLNCSSQVFASIIQLKMFMSYPQSSSPALSAFFSSCFIGYEATCLLLNQF